MTVLRTLLLIAFSSFFVAACGGDTTSSPTPSVCEGVTCGGFGSCTVLDGNPACACEAGYVADSVNGLTCIPAGGTGGAGGAGGAGAEGGAGGAGGMPEMFEACETPPCVPDNREVAPCAEEDPDCVVCYDDYHAYWPSLDAEGGVARLERIPGQGESVVTDALTGFMWTGCPKGLTGPNCEGGRLQTIAESALENYCQELVYAGHRDWIAPRGHMFDSLIDRKRSGRVLPTEFFPGFRDNAIFVGFRRDTVHPYFTDLQTGNHAPYGRGSQTPALCVRLMRPVEAQDGEEEQHPARARRCFRTSRSRVAEPIVEDLGTGLTWAGCALGTSGSQCENGQPIQISIEALNDPDTGCQGLNYAGHEDWVAPSLAQLMSLVTQRDTIGDNARQFGIPIPLFGPSNRGLSHSLWTNTHIARMGYAQFYGISAAQFGVFGYDSGNRYAGLCVRTGGRWEEPLDYPTDHCRDALEFRLQSRWSADTARFARPEPTVISEPIVSDALYGIDWTGCLNGATGAECSNAMPNGMAGELPQETCARLRWDSSSNWRLPTGLELISLHDLASSNQFTTEASGAFPGLDAMGGVGRIAISDWRDANRLSVSPSGLAEAIGPRTQQYVLCVRDQEERPPSTDRRCVATTAWTNGEPVVTDMENALQWMGCLYGKNQRGCTGGQRIALDHQQAIDMCTQELNWAGIDEGWRLPTLEEATRIMDLSRGFRDNNLDPYVFPARDNDSAIWTSTPYREVGNNQVSHYLAASSNISNLEDVSQLPVRCVRDLD